MDELNAATSAPKTVLQDQKTSKLSLANLTHWPVAIERPRYARASLSAGIVHFGVGNFHRAHMAVYLDDLLQQGKAQDWAILGAGVTPADAAMRERLLQQDCLSTVVEQDAGISRARVIGPMIGFLDPASLDGMISTLANPAIRIVSLTITEGGYFLDAATGRFNKDHPSIRHDVATPNQPTTVFGILVAALDRRRVAGTSAFTVLSCDNIPHNGDVTRAVVVGLARLVNPALAEWIDRQVAFPNSMVDRIAPAVGDAERAAVTARFGIVDTAPVLCEPFRQWVIEDRFSAGRPMLEEVGVTFVEDVTPFELMKIRMLNGGHAALAYPAALLGLTYVHEAMEHPLVAGFLDRLEGTEILPQVPPVPGIDLQDYLADIRKRFANPTIGDTIRRLCFDGSNRQPKFIVPTLRDALNAGGPINGLSLASALWCRYCAGTTDDGTRIEPNDPNWDRLTACAQKARHMPEAWLQMHDIYGTTGSNPRFVEAFSDALRGLWANGTKATLESWLRR